MLFCSPEYFILFLPIVVILYYYTSQYLSYTAGKTFLLCSSMFFYAYWKVSYLPILLFSIIVNFIISNFFDSKNNYYGFRRKLILGIGIAFNLSILILFKYSDFILNNFYFLFNFSNSNKFFINFVLPLGISFFTFQQVSYLIDKYTERFPKYSLTDYALFVSFFPQLIAGPILHHKEIIPQLNDNENKRIDLDNIAFGIIIFIFGLFKKLCIADIFSTWVDSGFSTTQPLSTLAAWITSLSYTVQIYYDFSGYCDMALGSALMLNINLPLNFNSPYKSTSIQIFWRKWHITLSRWLRDYVYKPLGGSHKNETHTYINILITFSLCGIWHGAGWTFILWGLMHGIALIINRISQKINIRIGDKLGLALTFIFINFSWVMFRSNSIEKAVNIYKGMFGINKAGFELFELKESFSRLISVTRNELINFNQFDLLENSLKAIFLIICVLIALTAPNAVEIISSLKSKKEDYKSFYFCYAIASIFFCFSLIKIISGGASPFLYFNF